MASQIPNLDIDRIAQGQNNKWNAKDYFISEIYVHNLLKYYPIRQNCYQLALCIRGSVKMMVNGKEYLYNKNSLALFTPNTVLEVLEVSNDYLCQVVVFRKGFLIEVLNDIYFLERFKLLNNNGLFFFKVSDSESQILITYFDQIRIMMKNTTNLYRRNIIRNLIIILLFETENLLRNRKEELANDYSVGKEEILSNFKKLLSKFFYKERKVSFYAEHLNISTKSLSRTLIDFTGRSAKEHIDYMVLSQAKIYLKSNKYNVSEVAELLNYQNIEEFSRFFKRKTGLTPLKFSKGEINY